LIVKRETLSVPEAAKVLGISRGLAYEMARVGKLPTIRFGKRLVVPRRALERLLEESKAVSNSHQE
jgi:excisionase family DNA binding protein